VQILESVVGSAGFVELPVTLWKEVPEEIRWGRKGLWLMNSTAHWQTSCLLTSLNSTAHWQTFCLLTSSRAIENRQLVIVVCLCVYYPSNSHVSLGIPVPRSTQCMRDM
jgi:hypothetical protein